MGNWRWFLVVLGLVGVISLLALGGDGYLFEDFSGLLSDHWILYGAPHSGINDTFGNPSPSLYPNGDGSFDSGILSKETFDFSDGLIIATDVYVTRNGGFDPGISLGLLNPDNRGLDSIGPEGDYSVLIRYAWDGSGHGWEGHLAAHVLPPSGVWHTGLWQPNENSYLNSWHRFSVRILPTRRVEFLIDGVVVYAPDTVLDLKYNNTPVIVGRKQITAFADNILVIPGDHVIVSLMDSLGIEFAYAEGLFTRYGEERLRDALAHCRGSLTRLLQYLNHPGSEVRLRLVEIHRAEGTDTIALTVKNVGSTAYTGTLQLIAGLSYSRSWIPEGETHFFTHHFENVTIPSGQAYTLTFAFPPVPAFSLRELQDRLEKVWTGYEDPEPEHDYLGFIITAGESSLVFPVVAFLPLEM